MVLSYDVSANSLGAYYIFHTALGDKVIAPQPKYNWFTIKYAIMAANIRTSRLSVGYQ